MIKSLFSFIISIGFALNGMSQTEWLNHYSSAQLEINYGKTECHDHDNDVHKQLIVFQFVNLTDKYLTVSFDKQMWRGGKCTGCDRSPEHQFQVKLAPRETLSGSCDAQRTMKALYIVEKMLNTDGAPLDKFELTDVHVFVTE